MFDSVRRYKIINFRKRENKITTKKTLRVQYFTVRGFLSELAEQVHPV